ncbi:MAG TPA: AraC family transcriptional regulator [Actinomycetospora sp.]|uniref:helix-turn-helix domain-containing protein n=1 Tax=Actinomycetospora sp. TaxID=1872135 RepID=UPI002F3F16C5
MGPPVVLAESGHRAPAPALRGLVSYHGYDLRGHLPGRHRGLPSPYLTFVVTFGPGLELERPDGGRDRFAACVGGLHDTPERIVHDGRQSGVHLTVHPLAARALFGVPAAALASVTVAADDVLGAAGRELTARVAETEDAEWEARFAALDEVLGRQLRRHDAAGEATDEVRHAWRVLTAPGPGGVGELAREVGWSGDHLGRRFRAEFGVGPKVAARMARFDRARRDVARRAGAGPLALADVAADHGYADQAHLTREFRALADCTPTRWVDEEVRARLSGGADDPGRVGSVQDRGGDRARSSTAWARRR